MNELQKAIEEATELKNKKKLEEFKKQQERMEIIAEKNQINNLDSWWSIQGDSPDVYQTVKKHIIDQRDPFELFNFDTTVSPDEIADKLDRRINDISRIKNMRSKEIYSWIADIVDEHGDKMVDKFNNVYQFGITDSDDLEFPFTFDFKHGKGDFFMGLPSDVDEEAVCKIMLSEKDFHGLIDKNISVTSALLRRKIRITGGVKGAKAAQRLVNDFVYPYLIG